MNQARHHHKDVLIAYKKRQAAAGAQLVKKDTGVSVGKNKAVGSSSPQAKMYNGDNSNLDNRLAADEKPYAKKFFGKKINKNI